MGQTSDAKERLINSTIELLHARSYADVGVQELCDHAGVKKGSFYHFFESKRDLTLAALDQECETVRKKMWAEAFSKNIAPLDRIQRYFQMSYEGQKRLKDATGSMMGCPFGNLALEMGTQDEAIRKKISGIFEEMIFYIEGALRDAIDAGELQSIDVRLTAESIFAYMEGCILVAKTKNDPEVMRQLGASVINLCFNGKA